MYLKAEETAEQPLHFRPAGSIDAVMNARSFYLAFDEAGRLQHR